MCLSLFPSYQLHLTELCEVYVRYVCAYACKKTIYACPIEPVLKCIILCNNNIYFMVFRHAEL